jgi:Ni/Co efflux regulator RcnB
MKSAKSRLSSRSVFVALLASVIALPSVGAFADDHRPPGQGQGQPPQQRHDQPQQHHNNPPSQAHNGPGHDRPEFGPEESRYARDYFHGHKWDAPRPKRDIYVGYRLSHQYRHPLPPDLRGRFHPRPGYEYYMVGDDIVLAAIATGVIVDILSNVH